MVVPGIIAVPLNGDNIPTVRVRSPWNPFRLVKLIIEVPLFPSCINRRLGFALMIKLGGGGTNTETRRLKNRLSVPLVPKTVRV